MPDNLLTDPRFIAAFYRYPELFQEFRNANAEYHGESRSIGRYLGAFDALMDVLPQSLHKHLSHMEALWDRIDEIGDPDGGGL